MQERKKHFGLNETYVGILRSQWEKDPLSVQEEWRQFFSGETTVIKNEKVVSKPKEKAPSKESGVSKVLTESKEPILGIAKKVVENMENSLEIPTATSARDIPVKVLEENRSVMNDYLEDNARSRCSFTHLIAYALVKAVCDNPAMNNGFVTEANKPMKLSRPDVNLGLAIDLPARDGGRTLVVPNLKSCQEMDFLTFFNAYNDLINRARNSQLKPEDFQDTTLTLTNTGGMGTLFSNPRLMVGQGTIIAAGRIGYPAQFQATSPKTLQALGIGKIMVATSTYDHRVIQGAESGKFLATIGDLLTGEENFYEEIFHEIKIPHRPYRLKADQAVVLGQHAEIIQTERAMRVSQLIHAYRVRGYLLAHVDPLHLNVREHPELNLQNYGLTIWDLDREFDTLGVLDKKVAPLRDILRALRNAYCRRVGVEYMYINDTQQKAWLQNRVEREIKEFSLDEKKRILTKLLQSEGFEHFLHKRYVGHKRFSLEGAEATIPVLRELLDGAASYGITDVVVGMAHRGRLNILANVIGKPYEAIFAEFDDIDPKTFQGSGDVKYHLGARGVHRWKGMPKDGSDVSDEREVRIELACNPSHLEAVDPIVEGQVRAQQDLSGDRMRKKNMAVLLHGDAAFAMQGVVYETMQCSGLQGYRTGGTVHVIVNNQIGYTTPPERARTSLNCSDVARAVFAPVFHVNGDDPEACVRAMRLAFEYRMLFGTDVVIDLVCYRRHGHNEGDEPSFTQPILYAAIQKHPSVATLYGELLVRRGDITKEELQKISEQHFENFEKAHVSMRERGHESFSNEHIPLSQLKDTVFNEAPRTSVPVEVLKQITEKVTYDPEVIEIHPRVKNQVLDRRRKMVFEGDIGIDFGMAEILAYGSLLLEGHPVRISGQDCGRGTFAHRHAVLYDINDGRAYIPLNHLHKTRDEGEEIWHPSRFRIYDSPLSEEAVLGFEFGYSVRHPNSLVIWEAQFGDFFNGAQVQIDQFISSSEAKWRQRSRLTLLLPHGYDGQGPEHSSARIERFLQMCAEENMRIANCTTPAQMFHLLRRQAKLPKKPLIIFTHKSLLRAEDAASKLDEFADGTFEEVKLDPECILSTQTKRIVFVTGKVFWDLHRFRKELKSDKRISIVRLEQLYPFPTSQIENLLSEAENVEDFVWLQEEPRNNGAYSFAEPIFRKLGVNVRFIGRKPAASPATGSPKVHKRQQQTILESAFSEVEPGMTDVEVS